MARQGWYTLEGARFRGGSVRDSKRPLLPTTPIARVALHGVWGETLGWLLQPACSAVAEFFLPQATGMKGGLEIIS